MSTPHSLIQRLVSDHRDDFHGTPDQHALLPCIERCRTPAAGMHRWRCTACAHSELAYNSCRNRHCPLCQSGDRARWVRERAAELLPVPYFHVVCTAPRDLHDLAQAAPALVYDLLLVCARRAIADLTRDPRHLGAEVGQVQVLHTWGRDLRLHPHVHSIVSGGGLTADGAWRDCRWNRARKRPFLVPVRCLSDRFRTLMIAGLQDAYRRGRLDGLSLERLATPAAWACFIRGLRRQRWVTYAKRPFGSAEQALRYLGRYTHRVAISDARLSDYDGSSVTLHWWDHRHGRKQSTRLTAQQFLQRFVRHHLPRGLRRLRMAGFLAPRVRRQRLARARHLLAHRQRPPPVAPLQPDRQAPNEPGVRRCPCCGQHRMLVCLLVRPVRRGPPVIVVPQRWRDHRARAPSDPVGGPASPPPEHRPVAGPPPVAIV